MSWLSPIVFLVGTIAIVGWLVFTYLNLRATRTQHLQSAKDVVERRKQVLLELAKCALKRMPRSELEAIKARESKQTEKVLVEQARIRAAEGELQSVQGRLSDLAEVTAELEETSAEVQRELDNLREQEVQLRRRTGEVQGKLQSSKVKVEALLVELANNQKAIQALEAANNQLLEQQRRIANYELMIAEVSTKYLELKRAYDALDIEYAQLYQRLG